jgi:hypothetical protein
MKGSRRILVMEQFLLVMEFGDAGEIVGAVAELVNKPSFSISNTCNALFSDEDVINRFSIIAKGWIFALYYYKYAQLWCEANSKPMPDHVKPFPLLMSNSCDLAYRLVEVNGGWWHYFDYQKLISEIVTKMQEQSPWTQWLFTQLTFAVFSRKEPVVVEKTGVRAWFDWEVPLNV